MSIYDKLTHLPLVSHICVGALGQHSFMQWLGAEQPTSHYPKQCSLIINWTPLEQTSVKLESKFYHFHSRKCVWKCCLPKWWPFCPGEMIWWFNNDTSKHNNVILIFYKNCFSWTYPDCDCLHFFMCSGVLTCMYIDIPCINQKEASLS